MSRRDVDEPSVKEAFWETLRRDPADPRDIARAYWRFTRASGGRRRAIGWGRWLVVGFVAGAGVVSAATVARHVVARWTTVTARQGSNTNLEGATGTRAASRRHGLPARPTLAEPVPAAPSGTLPEVPAAEMTPSVAPTSEPRAVAAFPPSDRGAAAVDPTWRRVSEALRVNDYARAETELRELETRGIASDRESASLSLAQILLSRGRAVEARARLERLSATARASFVRAKARALLDGMKPLADRSSSGSLDTH